MPKYGIWAFLIRELSKNMDVLAGYDSTSSTEEDNIQEKLASKQVRNVTLRYICIPVMFLCC